MRRPASLHGLIAILATLTGCGAVAAATPEIRATWITTTSSDDWSTANLQTTMNSLKQVGLNTVYVEAWKQGYTNFTSSTLSAFTGSPSLNPTVSGRNFLNETRTAAANAGLIHGAWFEYGLIAEYSSPSNPLAVKCRDATWTVGTTSGTGWLLKDSAGNYTNASNNFVWMNPLVPEVRTLVKGIVVDAINQFDLQIVQFDDHLAWPVQFGFDDYTKAVYKQETNRNLPASYSDSTFTSWRQGKTQAFFAEIAAAAKAAKPSVVVSLAPSTASFSASNYCADWTKWMASTDEVLPQVYRSTYSSFATDWAAQITASGTNRPELGAGLRLLGTGSATPWADLQQQIDKTRTDNALGHSIWYSEGVSNSGTSNPSNYNSQLTAYYNVAANGAAANPFFTSVRWSGTGGLSASGTWSVIAPAWKDRSTIWVQDALGIFDGPGGTVTVSGTVGVAGGLDFRTGGYTVTGGTMALRGFNRAANSLGVAAGGTATLACTLTGLTGLTKSGTGVLALAGTGTGLSGGVAVQAGMLTIGAGGTTGSLAVSNTFTLAAGGTLGFNRTDGYGGGFASVISGSGALRLLSGSLALTGSVTHTGGTIVSAGTLSAAAVLQTTGSITVDGGVFAATSYNAAAPLSVAGSGSATISGTGLSLAAVTNNAAVGRGVAFTAASGTITLAGLTGSGSTRFGSHARITGGISGGTVAVVGGLNADIGGGSVTAGSLTSGTVSGGTVGVTGSATITRLAGGVTTLGGPATLGTVASGSVTLTGSTASITTLSGGRVTLGGAAVTVSGGTFAGLLTGSGGSFRKAGSATLVLAGSTSMSAPTSVAGGILRLDAAAALGSSSVSVLAGGTLAIAPGLAATVGGLLPNAGGLVDVGNGSITVAAGLSQNDLVTAIVTGLGDGTWNGSSGITSTTAAAAAAQSLTRAVGWLDNGDGSMTFAFAAPGDLNLDGLVDVLDSAGFLASGALDAGFGATWADGDTNYDGMVDILDSAAMLSAALFDTGSYATPVPAIAAVPEPSVTSLAVAATAAALAYARRRRATQPAARAMPAAQHAVADGSGTAATPA
ncbi:MAG: family 10 glycosylhydrolase [Planctomycetaceae bacterium]